MGRVHQADHGIIHMRVEHVMDDKAGLVRQWAEFRRRHDGGRVRARIVGDIEIDRAIGLMHRIAAHFHPGRVIRAVVGEGRHQLAAAIRAEAPAMIRALQCPLAIRLQLLARRQRHEAVGTDVAQGEGFALGRAADDDGIAQHHDAVLLAGDEVGGRRGQIPAVGEVALVGNALFGRGVLCIGHGRDRSCNDGP